jgi:hypothetical protein
MTSLEYQIKDSNRAEKNSEEQGDACKICNTLGYIVNDTKASYRK